MQVNVTPLFRTLQVKALGTERLMVVADNHVSEAGWCCALGDKQRWFNEERFPVDPWLESLRCGMRIYVIVMLHSVCCNDARLANVELGLSLKTYLHANTKTVRNGCA